MLNEAFRRAIYAELLQAFGDHLNERLDDIAAELVEIDDPAMFERILTARLKEVLHTAHEKALNRMAASPSEHAH